MKERNELANVFTLFYLAKTNQITDAKHLTAEDYGFIKCAGN